MQSEHILHPETDGHFVGIVPGTECYTFADLDIRHIGKLFQDLLPAVVNRVCKKSLDLLCRLGECR